MTVSWRLLTPAQGQGAIAAFEVSAPTEAELDSALLAVCGGRGVPVGAMPLRNLAGVDEGIVARWSPTCAHLMCHGGPAVVRELGRALSALGIDTADASGCLWPEAATELERRMLAALSRAASPMAVDLLLAQPALWEGRSLEAPRTARDRTLRRLIDPPMIAAIGPANVGKSSLLNALAGRQVAVVADEPGTTVDHVGVLIDLAGLVVRFVDTPGLREFAPEYERRAAEKAAEVVAGADLVLLCGDASAPAPDDPVARGRSVL
ncbi:MAG: GTPase, partial [Phycisphaerales bacterium]